MQWLCQRISKRKQIETTRNANAMWKSPQNSPSAPFSFLVSIDIQENQYGVSRLSDQYGWSSGSGKSHYFGDSGDYC